MRMLKRENTPVLPDTRNLPRQPEREYGLSSPGREIEFQWTSASSHGGGYITGIIQDWKEPSILYARCDVAGIYKSTDGGASWRTANNGMTHCHHHSVQSFALSPHDSGVLFRCSGEARGGRIFGTIHKTVNGGESWHEVCESLDFYGNGPTRMCGEVIACDPFDASFVAAGGYSGGVWVSEDAGERWHYRGLEGERISHMAFHPLASQVLYAGTIGDQALLTEAGEDRLQLLQDFPRASSGTGRLYRSTDRGLTWELLLEGYHICELAFGPAEPQILYMTHMKPGGVLRSMDGGSTWQSAAAGLPASKDYYTIAADPHHPGRLYTAPAFKSEGAGEHPIPVYRSDNGGGTWEIVFHHAADHVVKRPPHMPHWYMGLAISKLRVDLTDPLFLYITNWFGVCVSRDGGRTWSCHQFAGIENTCMESIMADSKQPGKVYAVLADHAPLVSEDYAATFFHMEKRWEDRSSTAIAASAHNPGFLLYSVGTPGRDCTLIRSEDGGRTGEAVMRVDNGEFIQSLCGDEQTPGRFYAYVEGRLDEEAGLYASSDWGRTWSRFGLKLPRYIRTLPHRRNWVEAELLSVVVYQVKNACGTNQLMCCDPWEPGVLYFGERTEGLWRVSGEGGKWTRLGDSALPFHKHNTSVLQCIKADPANPGVLYAGFIHEGLWRSRDYGGNWEKLFPVGDTPFNASSVAVGGSCGQEIYVACEPLYWSHHPSSVYYSGDGGASWRNIQPASLGAIRWKAISLDAGGSVLYGASCGSGIFTARKKTGQPGMTEQEA
jgi:photosystem II stability/assembly factor-like uncharacterized protein